MNEKIDLYPHFPPSSKLTQAIYEGLKESYPSITPRYIEESIAHVKSDPKDRNIIDMFVRENLKKGEEAYTERSEKRAAR